MGASFQGIVSWMTYVMAFVGEIFKHVFDMSSGRLAWTQLTPTLPVSYGGPSAGQWQLSGNLPNLTPKGEDIVAALMTIVHYGLIAAAQFVTLLPYNGID